MATIAIPAEPPHTGKAFNIFSAALLLRMLADQCDLLPGDLVWTGGDVHVYLNHAHLVEAQLDREPRTPPGFAMRRRPASIFDYAIDDFAIAGYEPHPPIAALVAV